MAEKPFSILFIASPRLGEAVASSGLIKRLSDEVPHARFTVVAGPMTAPLFADVPGREQTIVFEGGGVMPALGLWLKVRGRHWGLIVDLRATGVSSFLRRRRRAIGHAAPGVHMVVAAARALKLEADPPSPFLFVGPETEAAANARTAGPAPILAIAPGASWVGRAWPAERFAGLAARLLSPKGPLPGGRLMILGDGSDREPGRAVKLAATRARIIGEPGQLDPLMTFACLRRVRLAIGNDSAAMQLAAAAGAPTLALFGPSDEAVTGPWGPNARVLRGPRDFEAFRRLDPSLDQAICHMLDLSVDTVVEAARQLLAETEPEPEPAPQEGGDLHG
jgi:ADP-heptose:LPS heptosyltransferase